MRVPTNAELEANAPDTVEEAVISWLARHVLPLYGPRTADWYVWAAKNLINDPEIRGAYKKEYHIE